MNGSDQLPLFSHWLQQLPTLGADNNLLKFWANNIYKNIESEFLSHLQKQQERLSCDVG
jgi:hypothetical protein